MQEKENASGNNVSAWNASRWAQTTTEDFKAGGQFWQVSISSGSVTIQGSNSEAGMASQVLDTGSSGEKWAGLFWDTRGTGRNGAITMYVRASDTSFDKNNTTLAWVNASSGITLSSSGNGLTAYNITSLPSGRYLQWRVNLTKSGGGSSATP